MDTVPLGEIALKVDYGLTASADRDSAGPKFLRITDLQDGRIDWDTVPRADCTYEAAEKYRVAPGDLFFARTGATTGKCYLVSSPPGQAVFASYLIRVRPNQRADSRYLAHFFTSDQYWGQIDRMAEGAAQPGVNASKLKKLAVPLPPLPEQKRIAKILDAAEALRAKRRESLAQLDALLQSTFLEMFGDCNRPPISIGPPSFGSADSFTPIGEIAKLATGHTPDRKLARYWHGEIPWIGLTDIKALDRKIALETGQYITRAGLENSSAVLLPSGTVCLSRTASVGFATVTGREMATSQDFVNWICGPKLEPIYLMWALAISKPYLLSKASGSTHKTIYYRQAERFEVFVPDIERQKRFAQLVSKSAAIKQAHENVLRELDALFESLQQRAFTGQL